MALEFFTGVIFSSLLQDFIDKIKTSTYDQIGYAFADVEKKLIRDRRKLCESFVTG